ncbi:hypothetical protein C922_04446 [Plasmodium inui San Antonio 1]|uniref:Uncharacterized protein n=1 Tax=Plasmodium inui San Antonio 1 TaxID=1237626 RepID=W7A0P0_9APIC|nr:hypothetical protein C922_04446 [Plasmodium inui San Antonio 1]EUD65160.1 hypothetical protein C922_04446 [Plasmodium inui San Antonio 1]
MHLKANREGKGTNPTASEYVFYQANTENKATCSHSIQKTQVQIQKQQGGTDGKTDRVIKVGVVHIMEDTSQGSSSRKVRNPPRLRTFQLTSRKNLGQSYLFRYKVPINKTGTLDPSSYKKDNLDSPSNRSPHHEMNSSELSKINNILKEVIYGTLTKSRSCEPIRNPSQEKKRRSISRNQDKFSQRIGMGDLESTNKEILTYLKCPASSDQNNNSPSLKIMKASIKGAWSFNFHENISIEKFGRDTEDFLIPPVYKCEVKRPDQAVKRRGRRRKYNLSKSKKEQTRLRKHRQ